VSWDLEPFFSQDSIRSERGGGDDAIQSEHRKVHGAVHEYKE
jgi:hypothetical protein